MPIYEYVCTACNHEMEVIQKMTDEPLQQCPSCHQQTLKKLISRSGFRLTGSGWYETDFKNKKKNEGEHQDTPVSDSTEKSTKPETVSEATITPANTTASTETSTTPAAD